MSRLGHFSYGSVRYRFLPVTLLFFRLLYSSLGKLSSTVAFDFYPIDEKEDCYWIEKIGDMSLAFGLMKQLEFRSLGFPLGAVQSV